MLFLFQGAAAALRVYVAELSHFVSRAQEAADKVEEVVAPNHVGVAAVTDAKHTCSVLS